jgi:hypothetical protein
LKKVFCLAKILQDAQDLQNLALSGESRFPIGSLPMASKPVFPSQPGFSPGGLWMAQAASHYFHFYSLAAALISLILF